MRQGFNTFSVPYMNELTAGQFNAASVFNGNMPLGFVKYSMDVISNFTNGQQQPQAGRPEDYEEVQMKIGGKIITVKRRKRTQIDDILQLPDRTAPITPPIAGGQSPAQSATGLKKCDDNSTFLDRILGRCCIGEIVNGQCVLVSDGKGTIGDDPTHSGKKVGDAIDAIGGLTELSTRTVVILVGLILLIAAIISLR